MINHKCMWATLALTVLCEFCSVYLVHNPVEVIDNIWEHNHGLDNPDFSKLHGKLNMFEFPWQKSEADTRISAADLPARGLAWVHAPYSYGFFFLSSWTKIQAGVLFFFPQHVKCPIHLDWMWNVRGFDCYLGINQSWTCECSLMASFVFSLRNNRPHISGTCVATIHILHIGCPLLPKKQPLSICYLGYPSEIC